MLLRQAGLNLKHGALTTPANNSAYHFYQRVLELDPNNKRAQRGIYEIADKYLEWAINKANGGHFKLARRYLAEAHKLDPHHPNIPAVTRLIDEREQANKMTWYLPHDGLNQKTGSLINQLHEVGQTATKKNATVVITARTDKEGRWIYQQMNAASSERIRASLVIGSRPSVRLNY